MVEELIGKKVVSVVRVRDSSKTVWPVLKDDKGVYFFMPVFLDMWCYFPLEKLEDVNEYMG